MPGLRPILTLMKAIPHIDTHVRIQTSNTERVRSGMVRNEDADGGWRDEGRLLDEKSHPQLLETAGAEVLMIRVATGGRRTDNH